MSERAPRKRISKEAVEAVPTLGLKGESPKLYKDVLAGFNAAEEKLLKASFDAKPEAGRAAINVGRLRRQIEVLRHRKDKALMAEVMHGIARMHAEAELLMKHDKATDDATKAVEGIEEKARGKRKQFRLTNMKTKGTYLGAPRYGVPSTVVQGVRYQGEPHYPVPAVIGEKPKKVAKVEQVEKEVVKVKAESKPEAQVPEPAAPKIEQKVEPRPTAQKPEAPPTQKATPSEAKEDSFEFVGDGPNDTGSTEALKGALTPEDSFEFVGDGPNDQPSREETKEKAREAKNELKRIIEEFYGGPHSLEPDIAQEAGWEEPKEPTHKGGVYAAVWTGRPEDKNPSPKEGRPAAEIVQPGVQTTEGMPKAPMYEVPLPDWVAERKKKEAERKNEEEDDSFLGRLIRRFK